MLEGPSYLISREIPSSCELESRWIYNAHCIIELSNGKRRLENEDDKDETEQRKPSKQSETQESDKKKVKKLDNVMLGTKTRLCSYKRKMTDGTESNTSQLFDQLGPDITVNCLIRCSRTDYGSLASLNNGFHSIIRSGELYRLRRAKGIVEHWVYFSCNLLEWEAYDPNRGRWLNVPKMTCNECFKWSDKESLGIGTELLVFGKEITSHVIYKYSILTNSWALATPMNMPRCLFGSASVGEIAIVAGGCDLRGKILSSAEIYNSDTGEWTIIPSMNKARKMCSSVFMDGKYYVLGGIGVGTAKILTCGEVYDLKEKTWTVIPEMFPQRNNNDGGEGDNRSEAASSGGAASAPPLLAVVENELYTADHARQEVRKYDKEGNFWVTFGRLPDSASSTNGWGMAFKACGDKVVVVGGPRVSGGGGFVEINGWVPAEGPPEWKLLAAKPSASFVYNCAVMGC